MKGKGVKQAAAAAARQWQQLHFADLRQHLGAPYAGHVRLPLFLAPPTKRSHVADADAAPPKDASISLRLRTNSPLLFDWFQLQFYSFFRPDDSTSSPPAAAEDDGAGVVLAATDVTVHVGPPAPPLGYPRAMELEGQQWSEAVWDSEAHAYRRSLASAPGDGRLFGKGGPYLPHVRWIRQQLLDGFVTQRVSAHHGVTSAAMLHAREAAAAFGARPPPHQLSPYYAANESLTAWCLFGEEAAVVRPAVAAADHLRPTEAKDHVSALLHLALAAAVLPSLHALWLSGCVLTHRRSGAMVWVLGRRGAGKTTLALHALAASTDWTLTAAQDFLVAPGTPLQPMLTTARGSNRWLVVGMPGHVQVGLGAALGTLRPNAFLGSRLRHDVAQVLTGGQPLPASATPEQLASMEAAAIAGVLRNREDVLWRMAPQRFSVNLEEVYAGQLGRAQVWQPAVLGPLRGVLLLDWDVGAEGASRAVMRGRGAAAVQEGLQDLLAAAPDHVLKDSYLIRSCYDSEQAGDALLDMVADEMQEGEETEVCQMQGSVDFDVAVRVLEKMMRHD